MNGYIILFFLAGPIILAISNLVLGPLSKKGIPFRIHFRAFMISSVIYLLCAGLLYYFVLRHQF